MRLLICLNLIESVCVELDVSKPLLDVFYLVYLGIECEIKVYYDCVPLFCGLCGKLSHEQISCLSFSKEKCGVVSSPLASSGSKNSVLTSLSDNSGSKGSVVEQVCKDSFEEGTNVLKDGVQDGDQFKMEIKMSFLLM